MSDEEKKAIESFKEENNNDLSRFDDFNSYTQFKVKRDKLIIDLIEKQTKEIEELKTEKAKRSWVHIKENGEVEPLFYVSEYKIKAKIEELERLSKNITIQPQIYPYIIEVLQSLLKEEE